MYGTTFFLALLALNPLNAIMRSISNGGAPPAWSMLNAALVLALSAYILLKTRAANRKGRCIAVLADGLFVRTARFEQLIDWSDVRDIRRADRMIKEERHEVVVHVDLHSARRGIELDHLLCEQDDWEGLIQAVGARVKPAREHGVSRM